ncbi:sensor histidine kinase [Rubrolithibacter danxiaensis]|uniref:sensor histidine kinase n=1 Tax=Rubrolithibacter danxiaensis TaxID=3390805 RepID=UPI003BF77F20
MKDIKPFYRKNLILITVFLVLIAASLITGLILAFGFTKKYVENEFASKKIDLLEEAVRPYNDFFQNKIMEISFYQGFLDSASVVKYADTVFNKYSFVKNILFYDVEITNHKLSNGYRLKSFYIAPKAVYQYSPNAFPEVIYKKNESEDLPDKYADEFERIAMKFSNFIQARDTTKSLNNNEIFNIFYSISPNQISYMNIPRREEMRVFKDLMLQKVEGSPVYEQDILSFNLSPGGLRIKNLHPELYEEVSIKPLIYEKLDASPDIITTELPLPGAFSEYKIYFLSSRSFLNKEILRRFLPLGVILLFIYAVLGFIGFLIYRNLNINRKMFKLQYDFINNFTHEFKTPVSVIKIAGNNIRGSRELSENERLHYGKILDEEADKLNDLMNKLLSFTQIENKSIPIKQELINMEVFIQNIIDEYEIKYPNYIITYRFDTEIEYFKTDPLLLASIFHNLIDNAYKYSLPDCKELEISVVKEKRVVSFVFKDKGIGIPQKEIDNIFKKFYRIQNEFNQQGSVGLGLAFCKELVNFMQGDIFVESKVGSGSEFTITLPFED